MLSLKALWNKSLAFAHFMVGTKLDVNPCWSGALCSVKPWQISEGICALLDSQFCYGWTIKQTDKATNTPLYNIKCEHLKFQSKLHASVCAFFCCCCWLVVESKGEWVSKWVSSKAAASAYSQYSVNDWLFGWCFKCYRHVEKI